jgi:hypothetical protein
MGRTAGFMLSRELQTWRDQHPDRSITMIRPNREIGRMAGRVPLGLFDAERAKRVYPLAREQGLRLGTQLLEARAA